MYMYVLTACGLEYCAVCDPDEGEHGYCLTCLMHTVLFEHECFACPLAIVALNGLIQEEELEVEQRDQALRQIERESGCCACQSLWYTCGGVAVHLAVIERICVHST